jgi:hypothetical protein
MTENQSRITLGNRENEARDAYLKLLENKGVDNEALMARNKFLHKLLQELVGKPADGAVYREAVEVVIEGTEKAEWSFKLSIAREYYPFWIQDIKAIAAMNSGQGFELEPIKWQPVDYTLKVLWNMLDKEKFSIAEIWAMKAYTLALKQEGAEQSIIDTRIKLAKLLLVRLRTAPESNPKFFRISVGATCPLFELRDTRRLFLTVVREFYYFWIGDPEAAKYINNEHPPNYF